MTEIRCFRCGQVIEGEPMRDVAGFPHHPHCLAPPTRVVITDVKISLLDAMGILTKFTLASIPVALFFGVVWYVVAAACAVY